MLNGSEDDSSDDQTNYDPTKHKELLQSVNSLRKTQHIQKPSRSEPVLNQDEFHLTKTRKTSKVKVKDTAVSVNDLVKILNTTRDHVDLGKDLKATQFTKHVLPKPLEKTESDRLQRDIGYEKTKNKLKRWDPIVTKNRQSDHQVFPFDYEEIQVDTTKYNNTKGQEKYSIKSELQIEVEALEKKLKGLKSIKKVTINEKEENIKQQHKLTRLELIAKRKEVAYMRMQQSQKSAKARLHNKIKSKTFHKLLKKEKLKEQLRQFELLQKSNPEAAMQQLEKLEKSRILERANLRHKNTGTWAKNLQVRAKYDRDVRKDLAEQLAISRELTEKRNESSDDDKESDIEIDNQKYGEENENDIDPFNPWVKVSKKKEKNNANDEVLTGYKKYWLERNNNEKLLQEYKKDLNVDQNKNDCARETDEAGIDKNITEFKMLLTNQQKLSLKLDDELGKIKESKRKFENNAKRLKHLRLEQEYKNNLNLDENDQQNANDIGNSYGELTISMKMAKLKELLENPKEQIMMLEKNDDEVNMSKIKIEDKNQKLNKSIKSRNSIGNVESNPKRLKHLKLEQEYKNNFNLAENDQQNANDIKNSYGELDISMKMARLKELLENPKEQIMMLEKNDDKAKMSKIKIENKNQKLKQILNKSKKSRKSFENSWMVEEIRDDDNNFKSNLTSKKIDDIFDEAEDNICEKLKVKMKNFKGMLLKENNNDNNFRDISKDNKNENNDLKNFIDLSFKNQKQRPQIDEELIELPKNSNNSHFNSSKENFNVENKSTVAKEHESSDLIDPNKFTNIKPKRLHALKANNQKLEDKLNDEVGDEDEIDIELSKQMSIAEAFEDDDVIVDFKKEKEGESKQNDEVNLFMPGWGSWAGCGAKPKINQRLVLKFPEKEKRRDENKVNLYINENGNKPVKDHLVSDLPFPFTSVEDYEASIRAPIGRTFVPETAFRVLTRPAVETKMGQIIEPMNESILVKKPTFSRKHYVDARIEHHMKKERKKK